MYDWGNKGPLDMRLYLCEHFNIVVNGLVSKTQTKTHSVNEP